jgi:hypothetical protein
MKKLSLVLILMGGLLAGCVAYDAPGRGYGGNRVGPDYPRDNQREVEHERREQREQREHWRQDDAGRNDHERYGEGHPHDNRPRD